MQGNLPVVHRKRRANRMLLVACSLAVILSCESPTGLVSRAETRPIARQLRVESGGGLEALDESIETFRGLQKKALAARGLGVSNGVDDSPEQIVDRLLALRGKLYPGSVPANERMRLPGTGSFNYECAGSCQINGFSTIYRYGSEPPPATREIQFYAYTGCSGYPSMTVSGGESTMRLAYGGATSYSNTGWFSNMSPYSYNSVYVSLSGALQSGSISTKHRCKTQYSPNPDYSYSSFAGQV